jgi:hypothetical protein
MPNETAYPLYWPLRQKRTKPGDRRNDAPFSTGERYDKEIETNRRWVDGQGWKGDKQTIKARRAKAVSVPIAVERLEDQLTRLDAQHPILSTNLELKLNGAPRAGQKDPVDSGAAVYFTLKGKRTVLACDRWARVADNIAALSAHIRALRSIENFGVGTLEQAFAGYQGIEDFSSGVPWRRVLGFALDSNPSLFEVERKWRERMKELHPDVSNDPQTSQQATQLNVAIQEARKELRAA